MIGVFAVGSILVAVCVWLMDYGLIFRECVM